MDRAQTSDSKMGSSLPFDFALTDGRACVLRLITEDDAAELLEFLPQTHAESDFLNYLPGEFQMTLEQEREFIRDHTDKHGAIALVAIVDGRIIACGGASPLKFKRHSHHTEVGLAVLKAFWHQGVGRTMMTWLVEWGRLIGLRKMRLAVFASNTRAIGLYESLGFVEEGRLRRDVQLSDGSYGDTFLMAKFYEA